MVFEASAPSWLYGTAAVVVLYLAAHGYLYYRYETTTAGAPPSAGQTTPASGEQCRAMADGGCEDVRNCDCGDEYWTGGSRLDADGSVICPECGTANEPGYRYCSACVFDMAT